MRRKSVAVNIYNFVRMSHTEPTRFIQDDFDTIENQIITLKQYGFPGTYALKYDALMNEKYQELFRYWLDDRDELGAWWEITGELCARSGVRFRGWNTSEDYDDRVDSAYPVGYTPEERKRLVDGYMADFFSVFGSYPQSIGSWVLDSITMQYAREKYGVKAFCICRDQMGVDGFTLWGGCPNGAYFPSKKNENIPAQSPASQIDAPVFRLLGPDPIYNFEADVRDDLAGVYTMEPSWVIGRDRKWVSWYFACLTEEDALGMGYAHVGQENNFLWENIAPGFAPQLEIVRELAQQGKLRVETMAAAADRFRRKYRVTPPQTFQASRDWSSRDLSCQWYSCANYRLGLLGEEGHLRIRDLFLYDENYPSRYLHAPMKGTRSNFDALPVLFPQIWRKTLGHRPYIRLVDGQGRELTGKIRYGTRDPLSAQAILEGEHRAELTMTAQGLQVTGAGLLFDALPVFTACQDRRIIMTHEDFSYSFRVRQGQILYAGPQGLLIRPEEGRILLTFGDDQSPETVFTQAYLEDPEAWELEPTADPNPRQDLPAMAPVFSPGSSAFPWGSPAGVEITAKEPGILRYTLDGAEPGPESPEYTAPLRISSDCTLKARLFTPDGRVSGLVSADYCFCRKDFSIHSPTELDKRPIFSGQGISDLLGVKRATVDYIDGTWRGTLRDFDLTCSLEEPGPVASIAMGFLSHHRSGIVYPDWAELWLGEDEEHLEFFAKQSFPQGPGAREIEKYDLCFPVHRTIGAFRLITHRHSRMPQWCVYRGTETVFTMADNLMVRPE